MSIFTQRFTTGDVLKAANISNGTLQNWIRRGVILGHKQGTAPIDMPGSPGIKRTFLFYSVMEIAVAKALVDRGISLEDAFKAAQVYSHNGSGGRNPGLPFRGAVTLLCAFPGRVEIRRVDPDAKREDQANAASVLFDVLGNDEFGFVFLLKMRPIFDRVTEALGFEPSGVLRAGYDG